MLKYYRIMEDADGDCANWMADAVPRFPLYTVGFKPTVSLQMLAWYFN